MDLVVDFRFSAAHRLPRYPGRCFRMHGHSYRLQVILRGVPHKNTGMVVDFHDVEAAVGPLIRQIDGSCWNDVLDNPTAEAIVVWCWRRLRPSLPALDELKLWETDTCHVAYHGEPIPESLLKEGRPGPHPDTHSEAEA